ncbi:MAG: Nramp family divalent metal transporter [Planctomycetota bacterium]
MPTIGVVSMPDETPPLKTISPPHDGIADPPTTLGGVRKKLGPGLIIAGAIVGSGELIATTAVGAEAGFVLMWLIIIGCLIKVFVQIEFGKYAIMNGKTTLDGMNEVPGPRFGGPKTGRVNWVCWFWLVFIVVALVQVGGIIGGVGQAVSIPLPLSDQGEAVDEYQSLDIQIDVIDGRIRKDGSAPEARLRMPEWWAARADAERQLDAIAEVPTVQRIHLANKLVLDRLQQIYNENEMGAGHVGKAWVESAEHMNMIVAGWDMAAMTKRQRAHIQLDALRTILQVGLRENWDPEIIESLEEERADIDTWKKSNDPIVWALGITLVTIVILVLGRYKLIQYFSTTLVAMFTLITIGNLVVLQLDPEWRVTWSELVAGMSFQIPPGDGLMVALAAFGIIGVGATELIQYPYWCIEKGYAKWTGPRDESDAWKQRAEGWIRVLKWDAWCSMVVYTFATIAFYLLGAAILGRTGLDPAGDQMVRTLGEMYVPVFGDSAQLIFLFGAFAVLYSTFFVATASHARTLADAMRVFGLSSGGQGSYVFWTRVFCVVLPLLFFASFAFFQAPKQLVLAGGFMGALMLPLLGVTALYGRYYRCDSRLRPGPVWDIFLWVSVSGLFLAGGFAFYKKIIEPFITG